MESHEDHFEISKVEKKHRGNAIKVEIIFKATGQQ